MAYYSSIYSVTLLTSRKPASASLVKKFRALRLNALQSAPESFFTDYAYEANFTDEQWAEKVNDPTHHILICERCRSENDTRDIQIRGGAAFGDDRKWVGMLILAGPFSKEKYTFLESQALTLGSDSEETRWYLTGLYLDPAHRCKDSVVAIYEAVLEFLRTKTDEYLKTVFDEAIGLERLKRARVVGVLRNEDPLLREFYQALAGYKVGWITKLQAFDYAGNGKLIEVRRKEEREKMFRAVERVIEC